MADVPSGRKVTELNLNDFTLTIGDYEVLDYFSDGSFYILNSPGVKFFKLHEKVQLLKSRD